MSDDKCIPTAAEAADMRASAHSLIREASAIQEMASRVQLQNDEDAEMLRLAYCVTWRLLMDADNLLAKT